MLRAVLQYYLVLNVGHAEGPVRITNVYGNEHETEFEYVVPFDFHPLFDLVV